MTFRTNLLQIGHIYRGVNVQPRPVEHSFDSVRLFIAARRPMNI